MTKKLEEFYPGLLPDTYVIHSEGGWHPWKDVPEAAPIYHEKIWPFIQRTNWPRSNDRANTWRKNNRAEQVYVGMSFFHPYPYINLDGAKRRIKSPKNHKPYETPDSIYMTIHGALGRAFLPNPENKAQVCHVNDDPTNYLLHNLIWGTNKENHANRGADSRTSASATHNIFKTRGWAKG